MRGATESSKSPTTPMIPHIAEPVRCSVKRALEFDALSLLAESVITSSDTLFDYACSSGNRAFLQSHHNHMMHRLFSACGMSVGRTCDNEYEWTSDACPCLEYPCSCAHLRGSATDPLYFRVVARPTGAISPILLWNFDFDITHCRIHFEQRICLILPASHQGQ